MQGAQETPNEVRVGRWVEDVQAVHKRCRLDRLYDISRVLFLATTSDLDTEWDAFFEKERNDEPVDTTPLDDASPQSSVIILSPMTEELRGDTPNATAPPKSPSSPLAARSAAKYVLGGPVFSPPPKPKTTTIHFVSQPHLEVKAQGNSASVKRRVKASPKQLQSRSLVSQSLVDIILGDVPSKAHEFPHFSIRLLSKRATGVTISRTYTGQLSSGSSSGRGGSLSLVKLVRKKDMKMDRHTELRAYKRLATAEPVDDDVEGWCFDRFVVKLQAFLDRQVDPDAVFLFMNYMCALSVAVTEPHKYKPDDHFQIWAAQMATGIHYLHCIGIIHRDVKPSSFLLNWRLNASITDLDLAWVSSDAQPLDASRKYAYRTVGTPYYRAPEVQDPLNNNAKFAVYGLKVDWWSYGMTLYELACRVYGPPRWSPSSEDLSDLMAARARVERMNLWDPWAEALIERCIPLRLHDILFHLLAPMPECRESFDFLYSHPYFNDEEIGCPVFCQLAWTSEEREQYAIPEELYEPKLSNNLKITARWKDLGSGETVSWISPDTTLFDGLAKRSA